MYLFLSKVLILPDPNNVICEGSLVKNLANLCNYLFFLIKPKQGYRNILHGFLPVPVFDIAYITFEETIVLSIIGPIIRLTLFKAEFCKIFA